MAAHAESICVIIPTLDERDCVASAIASVRDQATVIVVDGGSSDGTCDVAAAAGARVVKAPRGRGAQLAAGAEQARGDWFVFLHADTGLETGWADELRTVDSEAVGGAFRFAVASGRIGYRVVEAGVQLRSWLWRLPYGDQALFVRSEAYRRSGGIADQPLLEDVDFVRRLRKLGPLILLRTHAVTSARRWETRGLCATTLRNWLILTLYAAGASPARLARLYGKPTRTPRAAYGHLGRGRDGIHRYG